VARIDRAVNGSTGRELEPCFQLGYGVSYRLNQLRESPCESLVFRQQDSQSCSRLAEGSGDGYHVAGSRSASSEYSLRLGDSDADTVDHKIIRLPRITPQDPAIILSRSSAQTL